MSTTYIDTIDTLNHYEHEWGIKIPSDLKTFICDKEQVGQINFNFKFHGNRLIIPGKYMLSVAGIVEIVDWYLEKSPPVGEDFCIRVIDENQWQGNWVACWKKDEEVCRIYQRREVEHPNMNNPYYSDFANSGGVLLGTLGHFLEFIRSK